MTTRWRRGVSLAGGGRSGPRPASTALACPVCFQHRRQGPSTSGVRAAVVVLIGVTVGVLAGFGVFIARFVRRAAAGGRAMTPLAAPGRVARTPAEIDFVLMLVHVLMLVLFVGWAVVLPLGARPLPARPAAARRSATAPRAASRSAIEVGVVVAEVVLLVVFALPLWFKRTSAQPERHQRRRRPRRRRAVRVERALSRRGRPVRRRRRSRSSRRRIRSASIATPPVGKDDIVVLSQLHLPVNRPVIIQLSSKDVIHSFGVPAMRVKQDAIPGLLHAGVVHADADRRVRHRVLAALRRSATTGCAASSRSSPKRRSASSSPTKPRFSSDAAARHDWSFPPLAIHARSPPTSALTFINAARVEDLDRFEARVFVQARAVRHDGPAAGARLDVGRARVELSRAARSRRRECGRS